MKKIIALSILSAAVLSGCAVYPVGYEGGGYYRESAVVYVAPTYPAPYPGYIWAHDGRRWGWREPGWRYHR